MGPSGKHFALDTNLLRQPTARRLLHGIALETGHRIAILPEVHRELYDRNQQIAAVEVERWRRRAKRRNMEMLESVETAVVAGVRAAALQWYREEIERSDSVFDRLFISETEQRQVDELIKSFPKSAFADDIPTFGVEGDPLIVAQAIFFRMELLGSNNLSTIAHDFFNDWLRGKGWNRPLLHTPSETIEALADHGVEEAYRWFMAHGMNHIYETEEQNRKEFMRTLNVLESSGFHRRKKQGDQPFQTIVFKLRNRFHQDRHFGRTLRQALDEKLTSRKCALETELRLNKFVNGAVDKVLGRPSY